MIKTHYHRVAINFLPKVDTILEIVNIYSTSVHITQKEDRLKLFKKILVPIDGSRQAHSALKTALELAKIHMSELEILHVTSYSEEYTATRSESGVDLMSEESASPPEWINEYIAKVRENDEKMLSQALKNAENLYPKLKITAKFLWGRPGKCIVSDAEEGGFDLVVIGSRGLGGISGLVLGSVSHHVVKESKIPILVVKDDA